jgi:hypothetical protein
MVVNPAELDTIEGAEVDHEALAQVPWADFLRRDLAEVLRVDAVAVLDGWEASKGASLEVHVARALGMPVYWAAPGPHDLVEVRSRADDETPVQEAYRLVHGDRGADYGHPIDDFTRTGRMWAAILGLPDVGPHLVALCMVALKISREVNAPKRDNATDMAGYAETLWMVRERQAEDRAEAIERIRANDRAFGERMVQRFVDSVA